MNRYCRPFLLVLVTACTGNAAGVDLLPPSAADLPRPEEGTGSHIVQGASGQRLPGAGSSAPDLEGWEVDRADQNEEPEAMPSVTIEELLLATNAPTWEEYRDMARAAAGGEDYYLAEWDLRFLTEGSLRNHYEREIRREGAKLAVFVHEDPDYPNVDFEPTYPWPDHVSIVYCIDDNTAWDGGKSSAVSDMKAATGAWENTANVRFVYDSSQDASCSAGNAQVDYAVMGLPNGFGPFGCAENKLIWTEASGQCEGSGTLGLMGKTYVEAAPTPDENLSFVGLMRHELGHILGFRHEHPWAPDYGGCTEYPADVSRELAGRRLTPYDQLSVMHYKACAGVSGTDYTISVQDGVGARSIYGMPISWYVAARVI